MTCKHTNQIFLCISTVVFSNHINGAFLFSETRLVLRNSDTRKCGTLYGCGLRKPNYAHKSKTCFFVLSQSLQANNEGDRKQDKIIEEKRVRDYYHFYRLDPEPWKDSGPLSYQDVRVFENLSNASLEAFPTLVLNADFQPLCYYPLSLWPWYEAVKAVFLEKVLVLETYERTIRSPSLSMKLPSVVALKEFRQLTGRYPVFTRFNVFLRDNFICQYCGHRFRSEDLSFDHIIPRSRGGRTCWTNVVTACIHCNYKKGNRLIHETKDMKLLSLPKHPSFHELQMKARRFPPKFLHNTWRDYLYWDIELVQD
eukprot:jgi/Galph1/1034/GphlegSOOS_G5910.1